jgi:hypothetical protein
MADEQARKPTLVVGSEIDEAAIQVPKPGEFSLNKFKSTQDSNIANVETPAHGIAASLDLAGQGFRAAA